MVKREIYYESEVYKGVYRVEGSTGHYETFFKDNVKKWVEENSLGSTREGKPLVFDGVVLCAIETGMKDIIPPRPRYENEEFTYRMHLKVSVSPRGHQIPEGLIDAIRADGYQQVRET